MKKCPVCEVELKEVSETGVFVDVCPSCNGKGLLFKADGYQAMVCRASLPAPAGYIIL